MRQRAFWPDQPSFLDRLSFLAAHVIGMSLEPEFTNLLDACRTIRLEEEAEELRHEVVELLAVLRIGKLLAVRATRDPSFGATGTKLAPACLVVLVTARTLLLQVCRASAAIQPTVCNETWI